VIHYYESKLFSTFLIVIIFISESVTTTHADINPSTTQANPSTTYEDTSTTQTISSTTNENNSTTQTNPPTTHEDISTSHANPSTTYEDTSTHQTNPSTTLEDTSTIQTTPSTAHEDTSTPQSNPKTIMHTTPKSSQNNDLTISKNYTHFLLFLILFPLLIIVVFICRCKYKNKTRKRTLPPSSEEIELTHSKIYRSKENENVMYLNTALIRTTLEVSDLNSTIYKQTIKPVSTSINDFGDSEITQLFPSDSNIYEEVES